MASPAVRLAQASFASAGGRPGHLTLPPAQRGVHHLAVQAPRAFPGCQAASAAAGPGCVSGAHLVLLPPQAGKGGFLSSCWLLRSNVLELKLHCICSSCQQRQMCIYSKHPSTDALEEGQTNGGLALVAWPHTWWSCAPAQPSCMAALA